MWLKPFRYGLLAEAPPRHIGLLNSEAMADFGQVEAHGGPYKLPGGYGAIQSFDRNRIKDLEAY